MKQREFIGQMQALLEVASGERLRIELLEGMNAGRSTKWKKSYYERPHKTVLSLVPQNARSVLSIGCGSAETESRIVEKGIECVCIPLDSVIGIIAETKGVKTLYPNFDNAFDGLVDVRFDCILLLNILQYVDDPAGLLRKCHRVLSSHGFIIGTVPNTDCLEDFLPNRFKFGMGSARKRSYSPRDVVMSGIRIIGHKISERLKRISIFGSGSELINIRGNNFTAKKGISLLLKRNGIKVIKIDYETDYLSERRRKIVFGPLRSLFVDNLIFVGRKDN